MRIAITGANSAVGRCLLVQGGADSFVACVRSERAEAQLPALPEGCCTARISYDDPDGLAEAFAGCDALVHLPGVLVERPGSSYEDANVATTRAVVAAAVKAGVRKLVLVSAVGADPASANRYYRSKGHAEELLRASGLLFTVLRAPLVLGPGTEGSAALARHARSGSAWLPGGGHNRQQPLAVGDLARAALRAAQPETASGQVLDLVGPESVPDRELLLRTARALGRELRVRSVPVALVRLAASLRTRLAGPGFSPDAVEVITADTCLPCDAARTLGIELTPLDAMLERDPGTETGR